MKSNIPAREAPALGPLVLSQPVTATVTVEDPALDVNEIQGNILAGFSKDHQMLLFLRIKDATKFRHWFKQLILSIATTAEVLQFNRLFKALRAKRKVESRTVLATWINIAFSFSVKGADRQSFLIASLSDSSRVTRRRNSACDSIQ